MKPVQNYTRGWHPYHNKNISHEVLTCAIDRCEKMIYIEIRTNPENKFKSKEDQNQFHVCIWLMSINYSPAGGDI